MQESQIIKKCRELVDADDLNLEYKNRRAVWMINNRLELWESMAAKIYPQHLDKFKTIAIEVLSKPNTYFFDEAENKGGASSDFRKGVVRTIVLLGNESSVLKNCEVEKVENVLNVIVREIFGSADWRVWASLDDFLPDIAESAPEAYLNKLEQVIEENDNPIKELITKKLENIYAKTYLSGLIWSLERLAWSEKYVARVSELLSILINLHHGSDNIFNPLESLVSIFLPWRPQTSAKISTRINIVKKLVSDYPNSSWDLVIKLLPDEVRAVSESSKPKWRSEWKKEEKTSINLKDYWHQSNEYSMIAVRLSKEKDERILRIVDHIDNIRGKAFKALLRFLKTRKIENKSEEFKGRIFESLNLTISKHKKYSQAQWAMDNESVGKLEEIAMLLKPNSLELEYKRYFCGRDWELYDDDEEEHKESERLFLLRKKIVEELYKSGGFGRIVDFLDLVESPSLLGGTLGLIFKINEKDIDIFINENLDKNKESFRQFLHGIIINRHSVCGWKWVDDIRLTSLRHEDKAFFYQCLPFVNETWKRVSEMDAVVEYEYWERVNVRPHDVDNLEVCVNKLCGVKRPKIALECIFAVDHNEKKMSDEKIANVLIQSARTEDSFGHNGQYYLRKMIERIQSNKSIDVEVRKEIEWLWIDSIDGYRKLKPVTLYYQLSKNPSYFHDLICMMYKAEDDDHGSTTDEQRKDASKAFSVLFHWDVIPGTNEENEFVIKDFEKWVEEAVHLCKKSKRYDVGLIHIGGSFIHAPSNNKSGLYMDEAVAKVLDKLENRMMRKGYRTETINDRGMHRIEPDGKPEFDLALKYKGIASKMDERGYSRVAAMMREISSEYETQARNNIDEHHRDQENGFNIVLILFVTYFFVFIFGNLKKMIMTMGWSPFVDTKENCSKSKFRMHK